MRHLELGSQSRCVGRASRRPAPESTSHAADTAWTWAAPLSAFRAISVVTSTSKAWQKDRAAMRGALAVIPRYKARAG